jgi:type IV pilus assembly protein PilP
VAIAVVLGMMVSAPVWWDAWYQWQLAREGVALLKSQQDQLQQLQAQNQLLQQQLSQKPSDHVDAATAQPWHAIEQAKQKGRELGLHISESRQSSVVRALSLEHWYEYPLELTLRGAWPAWHRWLNEVLWQDPSWRVQTLEVLAHQPHSVVARLQLSIPFYQAQPATHASWQGYANVREIVSAKGDQMHEVAGFEQHLSAQLQRPAQWLEQFELSELRLIGRVQRQDDVQALFVFPSQSKSANEQVYRVEKGTYIGRNFGFIQDIDAEAVVINELVLDPLRGWVRQDVRLAVGD